MGQQVTIEKAAAPLFTVVAVLAGEDEGELRGLLSQLVPETVSIVVWWPEGDVKHGAKRLQSLIGPSRFLYRTLADDTVPAAGVVYQAPSQHAVCFDGERVRVGAEELTEPQAVDRFLASLAASWGRRSVAFLPRPIAGHGVMGLEAVRAAGGIAIGPMGLQLGGRELGRWVAARALNRGLRASAPAAMAARPQRASKAPFRVHRLFAFSASVLDAARAASEAAAVHTSARGKLKVWLPGCKTGTLVYAMAMLLSEAAAAATGRLQLQLFGTDPDEHSLAIARGGRYPAQAALGMEPSLRGRYTFDEGDTIRISEPLRELCIFSRHKLVRDPPLSRMDLVVCHRVFEGVPHARRAALVDALYFALREGGLLLAFDHKEAFPATLFEPVAGGFLRARASRAKSLSPLKPRTLAAAAGTPVPAGAPANSVTGSEWEFASAQRERQLADLTRTHSDLEHLVHAVGVPLLFCDQHLQLLYMSNEASSAFGLSESDRGAHLEELVRQLPGGIELLQAVQRAVATRKTQELEIRTNKRVYIARISGTTRVSGRGLAIVFTDVSALEAAKAEALAQRHRQAAIARVGDLALGLASQEQVCEEALGVLFGNIPVCSAGIILERCGETTELELAAARGLGADPLAALHAIGEPAKLLDAVLERESTVVQSTWGVAAGNASSDIMVQNEGVSARPRSAPFHSLLPAVAGGIACPILNEGAVLGVVALYAKQRGIDAIEHQHFVQAIANVLGGAIARRRTRQRLALELDVSTALGRATDLAGMREGVGEALQRVFQADVVELWADPLTAPRAGDSPPVPPAWLEPVREDPRPIYTPAPAPGGSHELLLAVHRDPHAGDPHAGDCNPVAALRLRGRLLRAPNVELLQGLRRIASMLGDFLERLHILEALRQSEASYRQSSAEFEALYASLPVGVSIHEGSGAIRRVNRHLAELEHAVGEQAGGALSQLYAEQVPVWLERVLATGKPVRDVELSLTLAGEVRAWLCNFAPIMGSDGTLFGASTVVQDITPLKLVEAGLREADQQKDDFLAMLGHELRNPMAAIRNATELLSRVDSSTPQLVRLQNIFERQTVHTTKLIDGLLDVARVVRGKVELQLAPVPIKDLVRQVVEDRRHEFRERTLHVSVTEQDCWAQADRIRMVQIVDNLLSNAIKFTASRGHIGISVDIARGHGLIRVVDDGMGIEPELLPRIFEPFRQGRAAFVQAQAGLGLGLALVKGLVELHGFQLRADSGGPGRGAIFEVEFQLVSAPETRAPESRVDMRGLSLLLVEDNADIAETLEELLTEVGHRVEAAGSGEEALVKLQRALPDVVLCDIGLPGMDGLSLAKAIRESPELCHLKLVAITGYGDPTTRSRIESAGFDRYLMKPVQLDALHRCLARLAAALRAS